MANQNVILPRKLVFGDSFSPKMLFPGSAPVSAWQSPSHSGAGPGVPACDHSTGRIIDFPGGLFAVAHCPVTKPSKDIPGSLKKLVRWRENSRYLQAVPQWLEERSDPQNAPGGDNFSLDLYLPIKE